MKKFLAVLLVLILIAGAFVGGIFVEKNFFQKQDNLLSQAEFEQSQLYTIQYLGYDIQNLAALLVDDMEFFDLGGYEYYLITPRYNDMSIQVSKNYMETMSSKVVFSSNQAKPFVLKANESDIFPNATIKLTAQDGNTTEITPYISLMDGSLVANEQGVILPLELK